MDFLTRPLEDLSKWGQNDLLPALGVPTSKPKTSSEKGKVGDWMYAAQLDVAEGQRFWTDQTHFTITVEEASGLSVREQGECFVFVRLEHGSSTVSTQFALGATSPYWNDAFRIPGQHGEPMHVTVLQQSPAGQTVTIASLSIPFSTLVMWKGGNTTWLALEPKGSSLSSSQPRLKLTVAKDGRDGRHGITSDTTPSITTLFTDLPRNSAVLAQDAERGIVWVEVEASSSASVPVSNTSPSSKSSIPSTPTDLSPEKQQGNKNKESSSRSRNVVEESASFSAGHWKTTARDLSVTPTENISSMLETMQMEAMQTATEKDISEILLHVSEKKPVDEEPEGAAKKQGGADESLPLEPSEHSMSNATLSGREQSTDTSLSLEPSEHSKPSTPTLRDQSMSNTAETTQSDAPQQPAPQPRGGGVRGLISRFQQEKSEPEPVSSSSSSSPPPRTPCEPAGGAHTPLSKAGTNQSTQAPKAKQQTLSNRTTRQPPSSVASPPASSTLLSASPPVLRDAKDGGNGRDGITDGTQRLPGLTLPGGADVARGQEFTSLVSRDVQDNTEGGSGRSDADDLSAQRGGERGLRRLSARGREEGDSRGRAGSVEKEMTENGGGESVTLGHRFAAPAVEVRERQGGVEMRQDESVSTQRGQERWPKQGREKAAEGALKGGLSSGGSAGQPGGTSKENGKEEKGEKGKEGGSPASARSPAPGAPQGLRTPSLVAQAVSEGGAGVPVMAARQSEPEPEGGGRRGHERGGKRGEIGEAMPAAAQGGEGAASTPTRGGGGGGGGGGGHSGGGGGGVQLLMDAGVEEGASMTDMYMSWMRSKNLPAAGSQNQSPSQVVADRGRRPAIAGFSPSPSHAGQLQSQSPPIEAHRHFPVSPLLKPTTRTVAATSPSHHHLPPPNASTPPPRKINPIKVDLTPPDGRLALKRVGDGVGGSPPRTAERRSPLMSPMPRVLPVRVLQGSTSPSSS